MELEGVVGGVMNQRNLAGILAIQSAGMSPSLVEGLRMGRKGAAPYS